MIRSEERILTTHTGSLPRPPELLSLLMARERGESVATDRFEAAASEAIRAVVARQRACGIDIVNDGELAKPDYSTYIKDRLEGFGGETVAIPTGRDARDFPAFFAEQGPASHTAMRPACDGPIRWRDRQAVHTDIDRLATALAAQGTNAGSDRFMSAVSPGQAARFLGNRYYDSHEAYVRALGAVLKDEYDAIAQAGFILQVDCPDLASGWNNQFGDLTLAQFGDIVRLHLEVLDEATRDVPADRLRLHLCWGNYEGPHNHDIALAEIIGPVLASRATGFSFEGANPRHEHEWRIFREVTLPEGKVIIPGVLDSTSNFIEHPELIADRLCRYASLVGREQVIAGTDCGFATFAGRLQVHPDIVWAKCQAMAEGAAIASRRLWGSTH
jgi:5-methyltetrahydropteroyltriglutamate--homocysteine methyltransferase